MGWNRASCFVPRRFVENVGDAAGYCWCWIEIRHLPGGHLLDVLHQQGIVRAAQHHHIGALAVAAAEHR